VLLGGQSKPESPGVVAEILLFDQGQQILVIGVHQCAQAGGAIRFPSWLRGLLVQQIVKDQGAGNYGNHAHGDRHKLKKIQ